MFLIVVYDLLTGKIVKRLTQHRACVRDVSWHPYKSQLISSSVSIIFLILQIILSYVGKH